MKRLSIFIILLICCPLVSTPYHFSVIDSIPQPCAGHTSAVTSDNRVFVVGGYSYFLEVFPVASNLIRIYDPAEKKWKCSRVRVKYPRMYAAMLALPGDRFIIAGGIGQDNKPLSSIELYTPDLEKSPRETIACKEIGNFKTARRNIIMNLIGKNKILVTGNFDQPEIIEINDDETCTVRETKNKMKFPRTEHTAVQLHDGRICFISGRRKSIELFDPDTETFEITKSRFDSYYDDQAVLVRYDGKLLIVGGQNIYAHKCTSKTWIYDPIADQLDEGETLTPTADGNVRFGISDLQIVDLGKAVGKPGEYFLLCGGEDDPGNHKDYPLDSAWIYGARENSFFDVGPMNFPHDDFKMEMLPELQGKIRVLIVGGHSTDDKITDKCEIFELDKSFIEK